MKVRRIEADLQILKLQVMFIYDFPTLYLENLFLF